MEEGGQIFEGGERDKRLRGVLDEEKKRRGRFLF